MTMANNEKIRLQKVLIIIAIQVDVSYALVGEIKFIHSFIRI